MLFSRSGAEVTENYLYVISTEGRDLPELANLP